MLQPGRLGQQAERHGAQPRREGRLALFRQVGRELRDIDRRHRAGRLRIAEGLGDPFGGIEIGHRFAMLRHHGIEQDERLKAARRGVGNAQSWHAREAVGNHHRRLAIIKTRRKLLDRA